MRIPPFAMAAIAAVICSAEAVTPWPKLMVASATSAFGNGTCPRGSPGRSRPTFSPKPKVKNVFWRRSRPSRAPILAAPMFELVATMREGGAQPSAL